jgi:hypothetical protein
MTRAPPDVLVQIPPDRVGAEVPSLPCPLVQQQVVAHLPEFVPKPVVDRHAEPIFLRLRTGSGSTPLIIRFNKYF